MSSRAGCMRISSGRSSRLGACRPRLPPPPAAGERREHHGHRRQLRQLQACLSARPSRPSRPHISNILAARASAVQRVRLPRPSSCRLHCSSSTVPPLSRGRSKSGSRSSSSPRGTRTRAATSGRSGMQRTSGICCCQRPLSERTAVAKQASQSVAPPAAEGSSLCVSFCSIPSVR